MSWDSNQFQPHLLPKKKHKRNIFPADSSQKNLGHPPTPSPHPDLPIPTDPHLRNGPGRARLRADAHLGVIRQARGHGVRHVDLADLGVLEGCRVWGEKPIGKPKLWCFPDQSCHNIRCIQVSFHGISVSLRNYHYINNTYYLKPRKSLKHWENHGTCL